MHLAPLFIEKVFDMDNGCLTLLIFAIGGWWIHNVLAATKPPSPVLKEPIDGATLERCGSCQGVLGVAAKNSVTFRVTEKNVCPHCGKKIKR